jgi:hypothetical protein
MCGYWAARSVLHKIFSSACAGSPIGRRTSVRAGEERSATEGAYVDAR